MKPQSIALLATGDEILTGDILNTNGQKIAHSLTEEGFQVEIHLTLGDEEEKITEALSYLIPRHAAIIITGGLGPILDDKTRFALAKALQQPLTFHEPTWNAIVARIESFHLSVPECNRQQALFPEKAIILPNSRGTAAGCYVCYEETHIFMLPGPPRECLPIFSEQVFPILKEKLFSQKPCLKKWRLFGVSEGHVATEIENALINYPVTTGYRIDEPYIEFKLFVQEEKGTTEELWELMESLLKPYLLSAPYEKASELLLSALGKKHKKILIEDHATGGYLATTLLNPNTYHQLYFSKESANSPHLKIRIEGFHEYWEDEKNHVTSLNLHITENGKEEHLSRQIPLRGKRTLLYGVEWISHEILIRL